ncbi:MAG TPA: sulfatase-like hydrolase/transferase [Verrucomicrobiota bacterium]|nr:sulfatase-like hydrolase/transferase [Verrucomicrobiota bacterium]
MTTPEHKTLPTSDHLHPPPDSIGPSPLDRRGFVKATVGGAAALLASSQLPEVEAAGTIPGRKPNILLILVDQFRFPSVFPNDIKSAAEFLAQYTPNIYRLWSAGVKFSGHYTAAVACTPARGTIITGLYSQQTWLAQTITAKDPESTQTVQPQLKSAFPTYGKLLRQAGYQTPYFGKWHVSLLDNTKPGNGLEPYGFTSYTWPDPTGYNLQGTVGQPPDYPNDEMTAEAAASWLSGRKPSDSPWCATVSFVNPHDKEFFWAGTEFVTYNDLFESPVTNPNNLCQFVAYSTTGHPPIVDPADNPLQSPSNTYGYPLLPPNWESREQLFANKPKGQTIAREFSAAVWGGVTDDPNQGNFSVVLYPSTQLVVPLGVGVAPFTYWQRSLDSYTQILTIVDQRVGEILDALDALPEAVVNNTVIVFTSDHGEYAGAHGIVSGKVGTCYDEAFNVPLIVFDPSGRFTGDTSKVRKKLTSTVDLLRMLVSLGHKGSQRWLTGDLETIYGERHNLIPMLRSAQAPGRPYVLLAYDERAPEYYTFLPDAPSHIVGMRTDLFKVATYTNWVGTTAEIDFSSLQLEYYNYATERGRLELDNGANGPRVPAVVKLVTKNLLENLIPNELRAPLPGVYGAAQALAEKEYLAYAELMTQVQPPTSCASGFSSDLTGYGRDH